MSDKKYIILHKVFTDEDGWVWNILAKHDKDGSKSIFVCKDDIPIATVQLLRDGATKDRIIIAQEVPSVMTDVSAIEIDTTQTDGD